jgi:hypothetical protein
MKRALAALAVVSSLVAASTAANAVTIDLSQAVLEGGAGFIAGGSRIQFDANTTGQSATFTLPSVPGQQYSIAVTGHNDASSSFFQFLIDTDGPGANGFVTLATNINFGSGFNTITLPTFIDQGTSDFLRIINAGSGNTAGQITGITLTPVPVPGALPLFAAGLGLLGLLALRRKRKSATRATA